MENQLFLGASLGEIVVAIITSLVASAVFWLASDRLPKWWAQKKVQPLIDYDLYQIYMELFFYIQLPFCPYLHRSSAFQKEIISGKLTEDDFKTFLSTKCLSDDYRRAREKSESLVPIGKELKEKADTVASIINQLYVFNHYLTAEQILLCRNILDKLYRYSYDMPASDNLGFRFVDPTLSYMSEVFNELYTLFLQLQKYIVSGIDLSSFKSRSIETESRRVQWFFDHKRYWKVLRLTTKTKSSLVGSYRFRALYLLNRKENTKQALTDYLKQTPLPLISLRHSFEEVLDDESMVAVLIKERSQEEYDEMMNGITKERNDKQFFLRRAQEFREYYEKRGRR